MSAPATYTNAQANPSPHNGHPYPAGQILQGPPATTSSTPPPTRRPGRAKRFDLHGSNFLIPVVYGGAFVIASFGGVEAGVPKFGLAWWVVAPLWLFIECLGVLMMVIARQQLEARRKTLAGVAGLMSALIAGGVAVLNYTGHPGNVWIAYVFAGASVAAYVVFVIQTIAGVLDKLVDTGKREGRGFRYPLRERWAHPQRTRLAAEILARTPGMTPAEARQSATDHPVMLAFIRNRLLQDMRNADGKPDTAQADGVLHVLEPHLLVRMFREQLAPYRAELVTVMVKELGARSLLGTGQTRTKLTGPQVDTAAVSRAGAGRGAPPGARPAPARRSTADSAALYLQLRAEHGLFNQADGSGWTQEQFAKAMGFSSTQRLRQIKTEANITDVK